MTILGDYQTSCRKILIVATVGGMTNAAPLLELGRLLAARGHTIEFATLAGREVYAAASTWVRKTYVLGRAVTEEEDEQEYLRWSNWQVGLGKGATILEGKKFFDSFWTETYTALKNLVACAESRPDLILADYHVDAVRDIQREDGIPIVVHWPQMPIDMMPVSYIAGKPGFQKDFLTSEHASIWQRIDNMLFLPKILPAAISYWSWTAQMRKRAGVTVTLPIQTKPDYLLLINSFFGLEPPKELPPLMQLVGPILMEKYDNIDSVVPLASFLRRHERVIYVAFGTHVILPPETTTKILHGLAKAQNAGLIDGVIWSLRSAARKQFNRAERYTICEKIVSVDDIFDGRVDGWCIPQFAPQRALLAHASVKIFLSHGGPASANEALYHGVPVLCMGIYFDQTANALRLRDAGVAVPIDKTTFTSQQITTGIHNILTDKNGSFRRNCERMRNICRLASKRKQLAVDLIEEYMWDYEGRHDSETGSVLRPMHLQTADARMSVWRARNWDIMTLIISGIVAISCLVPIWKLAVCYVRLHLLSK